MLPHGWRKYGLGAASMLVLVIAILLVSGWGTAAADQFSNVFVTKTSANHLGYFPAAPKTVVIAFGVTPVPLLGEVTLVPQTDVSAYREVTVYATPSAGSNLGVDCRVYTSDPSGNSQLIDLPVFATGNPTSRLLKTYDPAPPNFKLVCGNLVGQGLQITWMLVGRTG